jgi:putative tricarboxylic transport membrane protein
MLGEAVTLVLLPFIAMIALKLGDWEIFLVAMVGITLAGALSGDNPLKGWISALIGLVIAMVGMEDIWAYPRFGYTTELMRGFNFVPALIGLFGLAEVFMVLKMKTPYQILGEGGWVTHQRQAHLETHGNDHTFGDRGRGNRHRARCRRVGGLLAGL